MISILVQCNRIALLMINILVQSIRIALLMISIVLLCNRNQSTMHWHKISIVVQSNRNKIAMQWNENAHDQHICAMGNRLALHWELNC